MAFLRLTIGNYQIMHGFDENNQEKIEYIKVERPVVKLIAIDRIQSITDRFILTTYADRLIYWEYEQPLAEVMEQLVRLGLCSDD